MSQLPSDNPMYHSCVCGNVGEHIYSRVSCNITRDNHDKKKYPIRKKRLLFYGFLQYPCCDYTCLFSLCGMFIFKKNQQKQ